MKIFISLFMFGMWLIAIGIGAKLGAAIVWGRRWFLLHRPRLLFITPG
jgi:hypothetical protein